MKANIVIKKILLFIPSLFLGFIIMVVLFPLPTKSQTIPNLVSPIPNPSSFSIDNPPSESLKGNLATLSGQVSWESRSATESSIITKPQIIQQGETLATGDKGMAQVDFDKVGSITLNSKTEINFDQTLPINLVMAEASGSAQFIRTGSIPISIRAYHLLTQIDSGKATISVDSDKHLVTVLMSSGSSTLAWSDINDNTQTFNLTLNKKFIFDDDKRERTY